MEEIMDKEELEMIISLLSKESEIWIEVEGKKMPIRDYDWELEDNRIVLKP